MGTCGVPCVLFRHLFIWYSKWHRICWSKRAYLQKGSIGTGCHLLSRQHRRSVVCAPRAGLTVRAFAKRTGHKIVGVFKETASGARNDRVERKKVMALARNHEIDAILVTELSRWGRSIQDLVQTLMTCTVGRSAYLRGHSWHGNLPFSLFCATAARAAVIASCHACV
jgi:hypothetical protein